MEITYYFYIYGAKKAQKTAGACIQCPNCFLSFLATGWPKIEIFSRDLIKQIPGFLVIIFLSRSEVGMGFNNFREVFIYIMYKKTSRKF